MAKNTRNALVEILKKHEGLRAAGVKDQISSAYAPDKFQGVWIRFTRISNQRQGAHDGDQSLSESRYQFDIASFDQSKVNTVVDILCKDFNAASFTAFAETADELEITFFHDNDDETWEEAPRMFMASVDLKLLVEL